MTTSYQKQKKNIYSYRLRKSTKNTFKKLISLIQNLPEKDVKKLSFFFDQVEFIRYLKLGYFENFNIEETKRAEKIHDVLENKGWLLGVTTVTALGCPKCGREGYMFCADKEIQDIYMVHVFDENKELNPSLCHLGTLKKFPLSIEKSFSEAILVPQIITKDKDRSELASYSSKSA